MSEGLNAHIRYQTKASTFEYPLPIPQVMQGMSNATAVATGRDMDSAATRSRQRQSSGPSIDAAERRRLGREYLAKRNQELLDLKRKGGSEFQRPPTKTNIALHHSGT